MEMGLMAVVVFTLGWVLGATLSKNSALRKGISITLDTLIQDGVLDVKRNADGSEEISPGTKYIYQNTQGELFICDYQDIFNKNS